MEWDNVIITTKLRQIMLFNVNVLLVSGIHIDLARFDDRA